MRAADEYALVQVEQVLAPMASVRYRAFGWEVPDVEEFTDGECSTFMHARATSGVEFLNRPVYLSMSVRGPLGWKVQVRHKQGGGSRNWDKLGPYKLTTLRVGNGGGVVKTREVIVGVDEPATITLKEGDVVRFGDHTIIDDQRNPFVYVFVRRPRVMTPSINDGEGGVDMKCRVCHDYYVDPYEFQCGHAACLSCVHKLARERCDRCVVCNRSLKGLVRKSCRKVTVRFGSDKMLQRRAREILSRQMHSELLATRVCGEDKSGCSASSGL